jgi:hypothetical protein
LGKILFKILNFFRKLKKKKYSLIPLLRVYEEGLKAEERERQEKKNIQSKYVKYIYIHEPREYFLYSDQSTVKEKKLQFYPEVEWR